MARRRRRGRGWINSIERLPEEASPVVAWAMAQLRERTRTQEEIHLEFNARLAGLGLGPISLSAFNRHSIRTADWQRRQQEGYAIAAALADKRDPEQPDQLTAALGEAIKTLILDQIDAGVDGNLDAEDTRALAHALRHTVSAQSISADLRRRIQDEFRSQARSALKAVQKKTGLSDEAIGRIEREVLGIAT